MLIVKSSHLTARETEDLSREGFALYALRMPAVKVLERRPGSFVAHTVPIRLRRAKLHLEIEELARLPLVRQEANRYLGRGWGVATYLYDRAVVGDGVPYPAHEDSFDGYKCLKVYVFLTDCDGTNGALHYQNNPISGPRGTVVLFDPTKTHGSGLISDGARYIARAHLVEWGYVLKHLPEQLRRRWRPVSWVWRAWRKIVGGAITILDTTTLRLRKVQ